MTMIHIADKQTDELIGFIPEEDFWGATRERVLKDNVDTLDFETFADEPYSHKLEDRNRLLIPTKTGGYAEFILSESVQHMDDGGFHFKAAYSEASYLELSKQKLLSPRVTNSMSPEAHVDLALEGTEWQRGNIAYGENHITTLTVHMDAYAYLLNIAQWSGLELIFRIEHDGTRITGRYVDMVDRGGEWRGFEAVFGVNLTAVERRRKYDEVVTALLGVGPENDDGATREEILVEDNDALQRWGRKGRHLIEIFEPQTEDENINPTKLYDLTRAELTRRISHQTEYAVTIAALSEITGTDVDKLQFGDVIRVKDEAFNPPLYLEARVHSMKEDIKDYGSSEIVLGDFSEFTEQEVKSVLARLQAQLNNKISNAQLVEAVLNLAEPKRITQPTPPSDTTVIWVDNSDRPYIPKVYVDAVSGWVKMAHTTAEEVGADPAGSAEAALQIARGEISDLVDELEGFRNQYDDFVADGFISRSEALSIERHILALNAEKSDIDADYTVTYANPKLIGTAKTNLLNTKNAFNSAHTSLINAINTAIADGYVLPAEKTSVNNAFASYTTALGNYSTARANAAKETTDKAAADAKAEAVAAAATDATTKANAAKDAAILSANAKAEAERVIAEAYADGIVDAEEAARIADANAKLAAAKTYADTKANDALVASKTYADGAATVAKNAAITAANAKAEAERVIAEAYADGIVDAEEAARISDVNAKLAAAKTYADTKKTEAIAAAQTYADTAATNAKNAAIAAANIKAEAEREIAKAYADGIVDAEEDARITAVSNALITAASAAQVKADAAAVAAKDYAEKYTQSRGENLVTNGTGLLKDSTNFIGATFDNSLPYSGFGSFKYPNKTTSYTQELIAVDPSKTYRVEANVKSTLPSKIYIGLDSFDVDGLPLNNTHTMYAKNSLTELALPLKNGDTSIKVVNLAGFNDAYASNGRQRSIIWWDYVSSGGFKYPPESYSRNSSTYLWSSASDLNFSTNTISLNSPWQGGEKPAGTKLSQHYFGGGFKYTTSGVAVTNDWQKVSGDISGIDFSGKGLSASFHPYTASVRLAFLIDYESAGTPTWLNSVAMYDVSQEVEAKAESERLAGLAQQAAIDHANALKLALDADIDTVEAALTTFQTNVNGAFKDGIIEQAEAKAIEKYKNELLANKEDVDNRFNKIYVDVSLTGTAKTNLNTAKTNFNTAYTNLVTSINAAISDGKTTAAEKADVDAKFALYKTTVGVLSTRFEEAITTITSKVASNAETAAKIAAAADAEQRAAIAQSAAEQYAAAEAEQARITAEAFADGLVSDEEASRLEEAALKLAEAKAYADLKAQEAVDNLDLSDLATKDEMLAAEEKLREQITLRAGVNGLRNSIGYANLDFWEHTLPNKNTTTILGDDVYSFGSGFFFPADTSSKGIQQTVNVLEGQEYTLSWYLSRSSAGSFTIKVFDGTTLIASATDATAVGAGYESSYLNFTAPSTSVRVVFTAANTVEATLTGAMLGLGNLPIPWALAQGELYNAVVRADERGLVVMRIDDNGQISGYTNMSPEEFAGYYDENRDGNFERVFWLNEDETVTKKLRAVEEITMGSIKIVRYESSANRGWAFTPIIED